MNRVETYSVNPDQIEDLSRRLKHQLTTLGQNAKYDGTSVRGITAWTTDTKDAALYWGWATTDKQVPVLSDALDLRSNLLFVVAGKVLDRPSQRVWLAELVAMLPWQRWVRLHLASLADNIAYKPQASKPSSRGVRQPMTSPQAAAHGNVSTQRATLGSRRTLELQWP